MSRRIVSRSAVIAVGTASVLGLGIGGASGAAAPSSAVSGRLAIPHSSVFKKARVNEVLPLRGGAVQSANWAGYIQNGTGVTAVSTTFVVPSASLIPPGGFAATWAGIGGVHTADLIQAGVAEDSLPTLPVLGQQYFAWYELLPAGEVPLTNCTNVTTSAATVCTVGPGDTVSVNIALGKVVAGKWTITMTDVTRQWTSTTTTSYSSSESSADWVLEAPSVFGVQSFLANVGRVTFSGSTFSSSAGANQPVGSGTPTQSDLSAPLGLGLLPEATPSGISVGGTAFSVCSYTTTCAAP